MKIGILIPESRYYPYIGVDFIEGFKQSIPDDVSIVDEESGTSSPREVQEAARKLILKKNADIVTGWFGYKCIMALLPLIEQTRTPLIMCNAGETPLLKADRNSYVVHNSLKSFDSTYLMTKWAIDKFGLKYSTMLSFYDSGYPFSHALSLASKKYNGYINSVNVYRQETEGKPENFLEKVNSHENSFIFSSFSGFDAVEMIKAIRNHPKLTETPLIASPFFTDNSILEREYIDNVYSVSTWFNTANGTINGLYNHFNQKLNRILSPFGIIGFEAGLIVSQCIENNWKPKSELESLLKDTEIKSPRGSLAFNPDFNTYDCEHSLFVTDKNGRERENYKKFIKILTPDGQDKEILNTIREESSGWLNSFLCV